MKAIRIIFYLVVAAFVFAGCTTVHDQAARPVYVAPGVGLGTIIAVVVSWSRNKSIFWAIIHGILGWLYVIYAIIVRKKNA